MPARYIKPVFEKALEKIGIENVTDLEFELPKNPEHGDLATNIAMRYAKALRKNPRQIAEELIANMEYDTAFVEKIEVAGAGFINIKFTDFFFIQTLGKLDAIGDEIGKSNIGNGKKVNVEYVSVNPTGLLHLGHGRNACYGDTVANLYEWTGHEVTREYYFNNAGNQMKNLAKSVYARYMQQNVEADFPFPEDGYHGEYINEIAVKVTEEHGKALTEVSVANMEIFRKSGEQWCFERILATLARMGIKQDVYYNEDSLYQEGKIDALINEFKSRDLVYEKDGALWLSFSKLGLDDDRVIVKSSGEPTYRLPDIAYHKEKFLRGFDIIVDIFGSDHIATIPDVLAAVKALGFDSEKVKVLIHQFVTLTENGVQVKMSKRTGKNYTLDELLDEVGADVVRFFLIMRGMSTHLEFDLALAREQSDKNPVFYLQYAHARICSIFEKAAANGVVFDSNADISFLVKKEEIALIKQIMRFEQAIISSTNNSAPHIMAEYLRDLAGEFHVFYHECRMLGEEAALMQARLKLADVTRRVLRNGLKILGLSAPERM